MRKYSANEEKILCKKPGCTHGPSRRPIFRPLRLRRTTVQDRERKNEGATRGLKRSPPLFCPSAFSSQPLAFLSRLPSFPLLPPPGRGTPIIFPLRQTFGRASPSAPLLMQRCRGREGDPGRPKSGRSAKAGAGIARPTGPGRFAPMPRATRGGRGTVQLKKTPSALP